MRLVAVVVTIFDVDIDKLYCCSLLSLSFELCGVWKFLPNIPPKQQEHTKVGSFHKKYSKHQKMSASPSITSRQQRYYAKIKQVETLEREVYNLRREVKKSLQLLGYNRGKIRLGLKAKNKPRRIKLSKIELKEDKRKRQVELKKSWQKHKKAMYDWLIKEKNTLERIKQGAEQNLTTFKTIHDQLEELFDPAIRNEDWRSESDEHVSSDMVFGDETEDDDEDCESD
jgi:hypothetical protein